VSRAVNQLQNRVYRAAFLGGGAIFAYAYLEEYIVPFIPLVLTIIASLISSLVIRYIFVYSLNKRLFSNYRYTDPQANTSSQRKQADNTKSRTTRGAAVNNDTTDNGAANSDHSNDKTIHTPPDSLSLYRSLLGLPPRFTADELKTAYRSAAAIYHPDRYASATRRDRENAEDLMKKVNEAYECLKASI